MALEEPTIPARLQRPLAAMWISLGLHAAFIALVQVAPPAATWPGGPVIEARLVVKHADKPDMEAPVLQPAEAMPDAQPSIDRASPVATGQPPAPAPELAPPPSVPAPSSDVTITSPVDLTYYSAHDLDIQPRALREIVPAYPKAADDQQLSGKVRLQLRLEADGRVSDVEVLTATPPDLFDGSATTAFREARFAPAQKNGRPVRALVQIEVSYDWAGPPDMLDQLVR